MPPLATVGIVSLGDMGLGIARLLAAANFRVVTNAEGRSKYTHARAASASVALLPSDIALVQECDYILSIVPPRDALSVSTRIARAVDSAPDRPLSLPPLYYLDLNATSPSTAVKVAACFAGIPSTFVRVLDGGIIGGPPHRQPSDDESTDSAESSAPSFPESWYRPSVVLSGPAPLHSAPAHGSALARVLNAKHVHDAIGPATGLKMVFAGINKGFAALAVQAYATAEQLGVLPELQGHMAEYSPLLTKRAEAGMVNMCPKAYRWVAEMDEIAETMEAYGGWAGRGGAVEARLSTVNWPNAKPPARGGDLFRSISEIYSFVADDTPLGLERIGDRNMGTTAEGVAKVLAENLTPTKHTGR